MSAYALIYRYILFNIFRFLEKCSGPSDPGPCKNFVYKWKYEPTTKYCETFKWGGCDGNPNNRFNTEAECLFHCVGEPRNLIKCKK